MHVDFVILFERGVPVVLVQQYLLQRATGAYEDWERSQGSSVLTTSPAELAPEVETVSLTYCSEVAKPSRSARMLANICDDGARGATRVVHVQVDPGSTEERAAAVSSGPGRRGKNGAVSAAHVAR